MSIQLTGASAKILFESPNQVQLKKKLLKEGNFEIISSGPESATNLDKGITIVRTKQLVSRDALTDEPIYDYKEFPIAHPRENIADVFRRRLPRDADGQLTVPGLAATTMSALNTALVPYGIYLEPTEFTIVPHATTAFILTAKNNCVIFYGKISFAKTAVNTAPLEVYEADTAVTPGDPSDGGDGSESGVGPEGDGDALVSTITNMVYTETENRITADVTNVNTVTIKTDTDINVTVPVTAGKVNYVFDTELAIGTIITIVADEVEEMIEVVNEVPE